MQSRSPQLFHFRDARQERTHRRLALVGAGPASFYLDACKLMDEPEALGSTSHLVSHLLREVESAVRAVLQPRTEEAPSQAGDGSNHRESIAAVLKGLGVEDSDPVAQLWLTLPGDEGLDKKAHRNALFQPRAVDPSFLEYWERIETILDFVLGRFEERYLEYQQVLDALASIDAPTADAVATFKQRAPNNIVAHSYFFDKGLSPKWLAPLHEEGFFAHPPDPVTLGESISYPPWPQSRYLLRTAEEEPSLVVDIVLGIPATDNPIVLTDFIEAASKVPPEQSVRLLGKVESWIATPHFSYPLLPEATGRFVASLAEGGYVDEALDLTRTLMKLSPAASTAVVTDPELAQYLRTRAEARFTNWDFKEVLRLRVPVLIQAAGVKTLRLLCDLLDEAVTTEQGTKEETTIQETIREDLSTIWRSSLEDKARESSGDILSSLVTAVRDASQEVSSKSV